MDPYFTSSNNQDRTMMDDLTLANFDPTDPAWSFLLQQQPPVPTSDYSSFPSFPSADIASSSAAIWQLDNNIPISNNIPTDNLFQLGSELQSFDTLLAQAPLPSDSDSPGSGDSPPQASRKASQSTGEPGKKMKSCAACRLRRVKCVRDEGENDCINCKARKLSCQPMPGVPRKQGVLRSGKRVDQVKTLFGEDGESEAASSQSHQMTVVNKKRSREDEKGMPDMLRSNGVVAKLITTEFEGALTASLLELYTALPHGKIPLLGGINPSVEFEASGRRLSQLEATNEVLFSIFLALASRVSDHPLLIGSKPPTNKEMSDGRDLSQWGRMREAACSTMTTRAIELADKHGTWRKPTVENMVSLMLLEMLLDQTDISGAVSRPYSDAYMSQLRSLLEDDPSLAFKDKMSQSGLSWSCMVRDACGSASSGRQARLRNDDTYLLTEKPTLPLRGILSSPVFTSHIYPDPEAVRGPFFVFFQSLMVHISQTSRPITDHLTGPRALQNARIDEAFLDKVLGQLDLAVSAKPALTHLGVQFLGPEGTANKSDPMHPRAEGLWRFLRAVHLCRAWMILVVFRVVEQRMRGRHTNGPPPTLRHPNALMPFPAVAGPPEHETEYWNRLSDAYTKVHARAFLACREILGILEHDLNSGVPFGVTSGVQMVFSRLPQWIPIVLDMPTTEEGGPPDFTFETKLRELRWTLRSLHTVGWAFERLSRPAAWIRDEIEKLESRQALFSPPGSYSSFDISSASVSPLDWSANDDVPQGVKNFQNFTTDDIQQFLNGLDTEKEEEEVNVMVKMFTGILT